MSTKLEFVKYHGAGNDFILIDDRKSKVSDKLTTEHRRCMCDRHFGIGADGILVVSDSSRALFKLDYYNADGALGSLCGNGSRCSIAYVINSLSSIELDSKKEVTFECNDVIYRGGMMPAGNKTRFFFQLNDILLDDILKIDDTNFFLNNGSPHHVRFVPDVGVVNVVEDGREMCNGKYAPNGSNINFCCILPSSENKIRSRTFERGVDDETLACGTGATAVAVTAYYKTMEFTDPGNETCQAFSYDIVMSGGTLTIQFNSNGRVLSDVILLGPVKEVFHGIYFLDPQL